MKDRRSAGGQRAAAKVKVLYGEDFHRRIGAMGGRATHKKGFYINRELAARAGRIGGQRSRRPKKV